MPFALRLFLPNKGPLARTVSAKSALGLAARVVSRPAITFAPIAICRSWMELPVAKRFIRCGIIGPTALRSHSRPSPAFHRIRRSLVKLVAHVAKVHLQILVMTSSSLFRSPVVSRIRSYVRIACNWLAVHGKHLHAGLPSSALSGAGPHVRCLGLVISPGYPCRPQAAPSSFSRGPVRPRESVLQLSFGWDPPFQRAPRSANIKDCVSSTLERSSHNAAELSGAWNFCIYGCGNQSRQRKPSSIRFFVPIVRSCPATRNSWICPVLSEPDTCDFSHVCA